MNLAPVAVGRSTKDVTVKILDTDSITRLLRVTTNDDIKLRRSYVLRAHPGDFAQGGL